MSLSQENLYLTVSTPSGDDVLMLQHIYGEEYLSGLFHFTLEMISEDHSLDFSSIVGQNVTVTIHLADGTKRYINGLVTRFVQGHTDAFYTTYYAELRPWLWLLTLTADCRVFQNQTVPQIIEAVCTDLGCTDYRNDLTATYTAREYCVQYQESAFDFISRLMEDEGIFYFFEHADGKHTLVLADDADAHAACPGLTAARCRKSTNTWADEDAITACTLEQQVIPGAYAMGDFHFETPSTSLRVSVNGTNGSMRVYEYPGGFTKTEAGEKKAHLRLAAHELPARVVRGDSHCRAFIAGYKFTLSDHDRDDVNDSYVLRWVSLSASQERYTNSFEAFPATVPFRPPQVTTKPRILGAQTAMVVGKSGEEIWTDQYGRIKVQFHWDQQGKKDENSSCWVRVTQGWAGKGWGAMFLPRVGQEVVVSFLDGDPDRPLVTGAVYNAQNTVPYTLPAEQTKSTIKSNSSKGGNGCNELRFEDKKDAEEIFLQAQKDMQVTVQHNLVEDVLNDATMTVKQHRTVTVQEADDKLVVEKGNRTVQVNTGSETHEVKGTRTLTITDNETHTNKADFAHDVSGNFTLKVSGNVTIEATGSVTIKAGTSLTNKAGTDLTNQAGTSLTNKAGTSLANEAGISVTHKASASQTVDGGGMLTLKGGLVKIN